MAHPNLKLRNTDDPNVTLVVLYGHIIGSVERQATATGTRWYALGTDQDLGWGRRLRKLAVTAVLSEYMARTGSSSAAHNSYVAAVARRLEGSTS